MPILQEIIMNVATAKQAQQVTLSGYIYALLYFIEGMPQWAYLDPQSPPEVVQGAALILAVQWVNTSSVAIKGNVGVVVTKPNGAQVTLTASGGQDVAAAPGDGFSVGFSPFTLDVIGSYTARVTFSGQAV